MEGFWTAKTTGIRPTGAYVLLRGNTTSISTGIVLLNANAADQHHDKVVKSAERAELQRACAIASF